MSVVVVPYNKTLLLSMSLIIICLLLLSPPNAADVPYHNMSAALLPCYHMSAAFYDSLDVGLPDHKNLSLLSLSKNMPAAVFPLP
jgi:hypothetical protein